MLILKLAKKFAAIYWLRRSLQSYRSRELLKLYATWHRHYCTTIERVHLPNNPNGYNRITTLRHLRLLVAPSSAIYGWRRTVQEWRTDRREAAPVTNDTMVLTASWRRSKSFSNDFQKQKNQFRFPASRLVDCGRALQRCMKPKRTEFHRPASVPRVRVSWVLQINRPIMFAGANDPLQTSRRCVGRLMRQFISCRCSRRTDRVVWDCRIVR